MWFPSPSQNAIHVVRREQSATFIFYDRIWCLQYKVSVVSLQAHHFRSNIPQHDRFQRERAELGIIRHLFHDRYQTAKLLAAAVGDDRRHACRLHLSILVVQPDEASVAMLLRQSADTVLDHLRNV